MQIFEVRSPIAKAWHLGLGILCVDGDERQRCIRAQLVEITRDRLAIGAAFPADQNRRVELGEGFEVLPAFGDFTALTRETDREIRLMSCK